jgi:hypothetical protein
MKLNNATFHINSTTKFNYPRVVNRQQYNMKSRRFRRFQMRSFSNVVVLETVKRNLDILLKSVSGMRIEYMLIIGGISRITVHAIIRKFQGSAIQNDM